MEELLKKLQEAQLEHFVELDKHKQDTVEYHKEFYLALGLQQAIGITKKFIGFNSVLADSSKPLSLDECLREEFLVNTQNYPNEYHELFKKKYERAKQRYDAQ